VIDIHSHIIFGVDDGARDIDESIKMIEAAIKEGIHSIIATPHFHNHILDTNTTHDNFRALVERTKDMEVNLGLGFEITLNPLIKNAISLIKNHKLNKTEYILVESPYFIFNEKSFDLLDLLSINGFKLIIAHPERNLGYLKNKKLFQKIKESGYFIQVNVGSLTGFYGKKVKKVAKYLIKHRLVDFVASDAHREKFYQWYKIAWENTVLWSDKNYAHSLFFENGKILFPS
jgi:protein-tyrosine phosphatase